MKTWMVVFLILLALLAGGGYYAYNRAAQTGEPLPSQPSRAVVRQGDLLVSVSGSGELVAEEIPLAFSVSGEISDLSVAIGDAVQAGETLARLDDRQAEFGLKRQWNGFKENFKEINILMNGFDTPIMTLKLKI